MQFCSSYTFLLCWINLFTPNLDHQQVKKNVGFEGTFDEFLKFLKTDKKFFYETEVQ